MDPNDIPAQICANASGCQAGGVAASGTPATAANQSHVPQGAQYIPVGTRPNPYLGAGFFWYTEGNTRYNALQTDVTHRLSRGLQFRANYTWSKNLDMNSGLTGAQSQNQSQMIMDRNDLRRDWGPSALNVTSQASISARYELPFGKGKHWMNSAGGIEEKLIGGWQLNGITTLLSGFPFTPVIGANRSGDGDTRNPDRPSLNPSFTGPIVLGQQGQWFNPERIRSAGHRHVRKSRKRSIQRTRPGRSRSVGIQEHRHYGKGQSAVSSGVLQHTEPRKPGNAQRNGIFRGRRQRLGRIDHDAGHHAPADSIRIEVNFLNPPKGYRNQIRTAADSHRSPPLRRCSKHTHRSPPES